MWGNEPPHSQVSSHFGSLTLDGLLNLQRAIAGVKTHWIEELFVSLENSWNSYVLNRLAWPIWTLQTQVMAKRRVMSQIAKLDYWPLKVRNLLDFLLFRWRATYRWKDLNKGYNFALDLISIKILYTKLHESQLWEFWDSHLGVSGQNDIWVLALWWSTKYIIRGKVMASPKSRLWWVLWICGCLWLVLTLKALKLHTNQLVVWFVQVCVSNWCLSFFLVPISELQHAPLVEMWTREHAPTLYSSAIFTSDSHLSLSRSLGARHKSHKIYVVDQLNVQIKLKSCWHFKIKLILYCQWTREQ